MCIGWKRLRNFFSMGNGVVTQPPTESKMQTLQTKAKGILEDRDLDKKQGDYVIVPKKRYDDMIQIVQIIHDQSSENQNPSKSEALRVVPIINRTPTTATEQFVKDLEHKLAECRISAKPHTPETGQADDSNYAIAVCNCDQENLKSCINELASKQYCRIVIILLHVTSKHNLDALLLETKMGGFEIPEKNKDTFELIEMAYTKDNGIYKCELNDSACTKIVESCKRYAMSKRNHGEIAAKENRKKMKYDRPPSETKNINTANSVDGSNVDDNVCVERDNKFLSQVYLIDPDASNATEAFVDDLKEKLGVKYGIAVTTISSFSEQQMEPDTFTILICNNHSRILSDITESLNRVKVEQYKRFVIVVLHVMRGDNLPTNSTTREIQAGNTREQYKDVVAFIDMAFTIEDKIYECEMNTTAFGELKEILKVTTPTDKHDKET